MKEEKTKASLEGEGGGGARGGGGGRARLMGVLDNAQAKDGADGAELLKARRESVSNA